MGKQGGGVNNSWVGLWEVGQSSEISPHLREMKARGCPQREIGTRKDTTACEGLGTAFHYQSGIYYGDETRV